MGLKDALNDINNKLMNEGFLSAMEYSKFLLLSSYLNKSGRQFNKPSLGEYNDIALIQTTNPEKIIRGIGIKNYNKEFLFTLNKYNQQISRINNNYPKEFRIDVEEAEILYSMTRALKPKVFVETGVADGTSSFFILEAMSKNNRGKLISIDIRSDVGKLIPEELKNRWDLRVIKGNLKEGYRNAISKLGEIDIFLHDSDHTYNWQKLEYLSALPKLNKLGFLLSDDIDCSYAMIDFLDRIKHKCKFYVLVTSRKIFGLVDFESSK